MNEIIVFFLGEKHLPLLDVGQEECNTLLPHLPKQLASQGKYATRGQYDMI